MSLKHLAPQSAARVEWEQRMLRALACLLDCSESDAQDIAESQADVVDRYWHAGDTPEQCAAAVDRASHPADPGAQPAAGNVASLQANIRSELSAHRQEAARLRAQFGTQATGNVATYPVIKTPVRPRGENDGMVEDADGRSVAHCIGALQQRDRIVACVNACDGVDTNTLKGWGKGGMLNVTYEFKRQAADLGRANVHLTAALAEARDERDAASSKCVGRQFELGKVESANANLSSELIKAREQNDAMAVRLAAAYNRVQGYLDGLNEQERPPEGDDFRNLADMVKSALLEPAAEPTPSAASLRATLAAVLPYALSRVEDMHETACATEGEAGREALTLWREANDVFVAAEKLLTA
jgi:hypothetical protein